MSRRKGSARQPFTKFPEPLPEGTRVRVRLDPQFRIGPWPSEPLGSVEYYKWQSTLQGRERCYWVQFDEPQRDPDGDGPYAASEVSERYLEPVTDER